MHPDRLRDIARDALTTQLTAWAADRFPGITDFAWQHVNIGASGARPAFIGTWHGIALEISAPTAHGQHAWLRRRCATCAMYTSAYPYPVSHPGQIADVLADLARTSPADPSEPIAACVSCAWLLNTQARARAATTPLRRLLFRIGRPYTAERILTVKPGEPIPGAVHQY